MTILIEIHTETQIAVHNVAWLWKNNFLSTISCQILVQTTWKKAFFDTNCTLQKEPEPPTTPEMRPGSRGPGGQQSPTHYTGSWPDFVARFNMLSGTVYSLEQ